MVRRGQTIPNARKPRPHIWVSGPDPIDHAIYRTWATSRAQAHFRSEVWELTFEEYLAIWRPHWSRRGRESDSLCLTRIDFSEPWCTDNVALITRADHARKHPPHKLKNIARNNAQYIQDTKK